MKKQKNKNFYLRIESLSSMVTGSCNYCVLHMPDKTMVEFVVDCGNFFEEEMKVLNSTFPFNPSKLSFAIATHYHGDHTGRLPMLYGHGFKGTTYASAYTTEYLKKKAISCYYEHKRECEGKETLWEEKDAISLINNLKELEVSKTFNVHQNIEITFFPNAHCRGAIMCRVKCTYEDEQIIALFTGDYKEKTDVRRSWIPQEFKTEGRVTIITEATYGLKEQPVKCFDKRIGQCIERGGNVLISALGDETFESTIIRIKHLKKNGIVGQETPIYISTSRKFEITDKMLQSMPSNITFIKNTNEKEMAKYDQRQKIIIVKERGSLQTFLPYMIKNNKNTLIFTNHLPSTSNLRKILELQRGEELIYAGQKIQKLAQVYNTEEFGCHSFIEELERLIKSFDKVNAVLFGHGDKYAKQEVANYTGVTLDIKSFILKRGRAFRITPNEVKYECTK